LLTQTLDLLLLGLDCFLCGGELFLERGAVEAFGLDVLDAGLIWWRHTEYAAVGVLFVLCVEFHSFYVRRIPPN
jgi:hypothetical protein